MLRRPVLAGPPDVGGHPTEAAVRAMALASLAFTLPSETIPFVVGFVQASPAAIPGLALLLGSQLGALAAVMPRRHHPATPWLLLAALAGGIAQMMAHRGSYPAAELLLPGYWIFPLVALSMRTRRRRDYIPFAVVAAGAMMLVQANFVHSATWLEVADQLWIVQPTVLALLFGDAVISIDRDRTAAIEQGLRSQREQAALALERAGRAEAERLEQQLVLPALRSLVRGGSRAELGALCRRVVTEVDQVRSHRRTARIESLVCETTPVVVEGRTAPVPAAMAEAMAQATRAVLSTSGCTPTAPRCRVEVAQQGDLRQVRVAPAEPVALDRLGRGREAFAAMDRIGGEVVQEGDAVVLRWPRDEHAPRGSGWEEVPDRIARSRLTRTAWPTVATTAVMTVLVAPHLEHSLAAWLLGAALAGTGAVTAVALQRRALPRTVLAALLGVALAGWLANLVLVARPPQIDYPLWLGWGASALVHLVVLGQRLRTGLWITLAWVVVQSLSLVVRYDGAAVLWRHSFLLLTGPGDVVVTLLVLWVARRAAVRQAEEAQASSRLAAATTRLQIASGVQQYWTRSVASKALPLLAQVATGRVDGDDPEVAERARAVQQAVAMERSSASSSD